MRQSGATVFSAVDRPCAHGMSAQSRSPAEPQLACASLTACQPGSGRALACRTVIHAIYYTVMLWRRNRKCVQHLYSIIRHRLMFARCIAAECAFGAAAAVAIWLVQIVDVRPFAGSPRWG